jgi:hypothetical protein
MVRGQRGKESLLQVAGTPLLPVLGVWLLLLMVMMVTIMVVQCVWVC